MKGNLQEMTIDELNKSLGDSLEEIRVERFKSITGKLDNPKKINMLKKKIARINTLKKEYELGIRQLKK